ncbi:MAG: lipase family protein [Aeromicrobium sp.]
MGFVAAATFTGVLGVPTASTAATSPLDNPFFSYTGKEPLSQVPPGTVLKTRTVPYTIQGLPILLKAIQVQFRTKDAIGKPAIGITTVVRPILPLQQTVKVVSYQSFYDSLNREDQPSAAIAGGQGLGKGIVNAETLLIAPLLLAGFTVNIPDTQGQNADFAAGPEYGVVTLDSLKAISNVAATGVGTKSPIGLIGYSGGAIGTEWAAEQAPAYAPTISKRIVGSAFGGVLVSPIHNLHYADGSFGWSGVVAMALVGLSRAYHVDLTPYLSDYGKTLTTTLQKASISEAIFQYPDLTFAKMVKPQYAVPETIKPLVTIGNKLIMGTYGTPTAPMFIGQGTGGEVEGTMGNKPGIGPGDGVMIAGDVRSLARKYCAKGVTITHREYPLSHIGTVALWLPEALPWLLARFTDTPAQSNCATIQPGNSIAPITYVGK